MKVPKKKTEEEVVKQLIYKLNNFKERQYPILDLMAAGILLLPDNHSNIVQLFFNLKNAISSISIESDDSNVVFFSWKKGEDYIDTTDNLNIKLFAVELYHFKLYVVNLINNMHSFNSHSSKLSELYSELDEIISEYLNN